MSIQHNGYICEKGKTHGNLQSLDLSRIGSVKDLRKLFERFLRSKPTDVGHLLIFFSSINSHGHVVIS